MIKTKNHRVFLVEDDLSFGSVLKSYMELNDFTVHWVDDGKYAIDSFRRSDFDICILDVMLPNVDGFTIADGIKKIAPQVPIVFLTAKKLKEDILKGYGLGADDYITKPFDTEILLAKVRAVIKAREMGTETKDLYEIGSYNLNPKLRILKRGDKEVKLSPKEAQLLEMLVVNVNNLVTREMALRKIWGNDDYFTARSMDVYITKLRKYLSDDGTINIKNIHGSGFQLIVLPD